MGALSMLKLAELIWGRLLRRVDEVGVGVFWWIFVNDSLMNCAMLSPVKVPMGVLRDVMTGEEVDCRSEEMKVDGSSPLRSL